MAVFRESPYPGFDFEVEVADFDPMAFQEVSGLGADVGVIEYRNGNDRERLLRKQPGIKTYTPIVLRRGIVGDLALWEWFDSVGKSNPVDRRTVRITLLNEDHEPVLTWRVVNAWVSKWTGPSLDATRNAVAIDTIELTHEGLDLA